MKNKSQFCRNWPKHTLQLLILALVIFFMSGLAAAIFTKMQPVDAERYCPMGGLQAFVTYFVRGSLPCSMTSMQIVMGLALAAAVVLFSKLFCGYICPVGTVEDLLARLRKALGVKGCEIRNGSCADKVLRIVKYGLLFWIVYMSATASELFCKNLDPYYAVATGFKGEITLWMSIATLAIVILLGFFVKRFWCRYVCPLGAISNTLKFWVWLLAGALVFLALNVLGIKIEWWWMLAAFCLAGYLLEILCGKPKFQTLHVVVDQSKCGRSCYSCQKMCPYNIDVPAEGGIVRNVDCVLCGECVAACPTKALSIGCCTESKCKCGFMKFLPAILALLLLVAAYIIGGKFELPTIDVTWNVEEGMELTTMKVENLSSVKCYGSSMAFKARLEKIGGVHGVKTYVGSHTVVIKYDPSKTNEDKLLEQIFTPSNFRVWSPDPKKLSELKIYTIRTEHMYDKMDLNRLGLQFRTTGKSIFGVESEYNCPLIVRVYVAPDEQLDEEFFREVVNRKVLAMPVHGGGVKETPVDFEFVRMEKGEGHIAIDEYLHMMFSEFKADFNGEYPSGDTTVIMKRYEKYAGQPQFVYEVADQNYEKPIIKRGLPFLSNHLSKEEGVIGLYLVLNKDLVPSIKIRFAAPMTAERIWELMNMETWTITYAKDDVREEKARLKFKSEGICYPWTEPEAATE